MLQPTGHWLISFELLVYSPSAEAEIRHKIGS